MLEFWYKALHSAHGICIRVDDPDRAKQKLYAARREAEASDPALASLSITQSPTDPLSELWIVKNGSEKAE